MNASHANGTHHRKTGTVDPERNEKATMRPARKGKQVAWVTNMVVAGLALPIATPPTVAGMNRVLPFMTEQRVEQRREREWERDKEWAEPSGRTPPPAARLRREGAERATAAAHHGIAIAARRRSDPPERG